MMQNLVSGDPRSERLQVKKWSMLPAQVMMREAMTLTFPPKNLPGPGKKNNNKPPISFELRMLYSYDILTRG